MKPLISLIIGKYCRSVAVTYYIKSSEVMAAPSMTDINFPRIKMRKVVASTAALAVFMVGCATSSKDVATTYVSPLQFQGYDCAQIAAETQRIQSRVVELGGRLDQAASNDRAIAGVGMILFWPALFALGGTKAQEAEFGRLKGEYEALQKTAIEKKCSGMVPAAPAPVQAAASAAA